VDSVSPKGSVTFYHTVRQPFYNESGIGTDDASVPSSPADGGEMEDSGPAVPAERERDGVEIGSMDPMMQKTVAELAALLEAVVANQVKTGKMLLESRDIPLDMKDVLSDRIRTHERDLQRIRKLLATLEPAKKRS
jgi:hypothetical protein